jgi:hypothetical protein
MADSPKTHPYLFFTAQSREQLRARAAGEPFRRLYQRLTHRADECVSRALPPEVVFNPDNLPMKLADGSYNPVYAKLEYANLYFLQAYEMREVIPTLGFAYQLTGDARYADAGKKWLLAFARRDKLTTPGREADFHMAQAMYSMALAYDWLWEVMNEEERTVVRQRLAQLSLPMHAAGKRILERPPEAIEQEMRSSLGGNHFKRTHGMFSLTPLALLYEVPEARQWLDVEIQVQRDRIYPSSYAPNGEYMDAWDHYKSSLDDGITFVVALRHMGGEDFFHDASLGVRFKGMPHYFLYGLEMRTIDQQWNRHGWSGRDTETNTYAWLALASAFKDPVAQWIATRDQGLDKLDEVFACLLYDPSVPAAPPQDPSGGVYFPYGGLVKLCTDWGPQGILVPFRCGPRPMLDLGDQNGIRLRAYGEWLMPRLQQTDRLPEQTDAFIYDLMGWFWGSPAQNAVVADPDDIADYESYRKTGAIPVGGGVQWSTYTLFKANMAPTSPAEKATMPKPSHVKREEWLTGVETPKSGDLHVVSLDAALDYVCGENQRSFFFFQPALSRRHVLLVKVQPGQKGPYALICDEIESDELPRTFAWQLHAGSAQSVPGNRLKVQGQHAGMDVTWLLPEDGVLVRKLTPAPIESERTEFVQYRTGRPEKRCVYLTALVPQIPGAQDAPPAMRAIEVLGGWGVEVRGAGWTDVVMFRSKRSEKMSAVGITTTGTAALLRRGRSGESVLYTLGK